MNPGLEKLQDYPFERLRNLKSKIPLKEHSSLIDLSIGEPRTELPKMEVPDAAVEGNIEGFNLMGTEPDRAKKVFERLMETYPDFEWPFTNLAKIYIKEGNIEKAKGLAKYAHSVNRDLLRPIELMAHIELELENDQKALAKNETKLKKNNQNLQFFEGCAAV